MTDPLATFNQLSVEDAVAALATCLHAGDWVRAVESGRPYATVDSLSTRAMAAARGLSRSGLTEALSAHPRIGDRPGGGGIAAAFSRAEQSGVDDDAATQAALQVANVAYEARFGHVFLIRAAGRDAREILDAARSRLANTDEAEAVEVREQLGQIAVLRLERVLGSLTPRPPDPPNDVLE